jgi:uncharacterized protein (DUF2252 family)
VAKSIKQSTKAYERWLKAQLGGDIVKDDLREKHEKMAENSFVFLRATYWRWAETIYDICPALEGAPQVLTVGDIHLENYGVWRDADGRLVWGVNDFDEAAEMPYGLDLVRLATSAVLARGRRGGSTATICASIVRGYREGLRKPAAFVLDRDHCWLRLQFEVDDTERENYWNDIDTKRKKAERKNKMPRGRFRKRLEGAMPKAVIELSFWRSSAGTGSLGRPRWVACGEWRGAPVMREVKALVPSAWTRIAGRGRPAIRCGDIANGKFRAPDPWYRVRAKTVLRRLSPNSRKLEIDDCGSALLDAYMLRLMGHELANAHLGTARPRIAKDIEKDLRKRKPRWLVKAVEEAAAFVRREHREWSKLHG